MTATLSLMFSKLSIALVLFLVATIIVSIFELSREDQASVFRKINIPINLIILTFYVEPKHCKCHEAGQLYKPTPENHESLSDVIKGILPYFERRSIAFRGSKEAYLLLFMFE
ncbi:hypothetical protein K501DRAFT_279898 [Backusella circina FSU 941]|nr:hypothetical protein K501DRAFT_279898 [Backusella circina FSU 941]